MNKVQYPNGSKEYTCSPQIRSNEKAYGNQAGTKSSKDDDKDQPGQLDAFTEDVESTRTLDKEIIKSQLTKTKGRDSRTTTTDNLINTGKLKQVNT